MRRLILPLALVATAVSGLSGCGQKGPLYFPPPPAATASPQTSAQPAHATTTSQSPAPASSARTPFNSVLHQ
jgi:predicted small lipoprotein YifL